MHVCVTIYIYMVQSATSWRTVYSKEKQEEEGSLEEEEEERGLCRIEKQ